MSPLLEVTEDTPPDMLTGSMDLRLVLPDGNRVRMSVDRRTPMMDLLVQVTTAYKISPAGNVLQPYGESGILPYKPSTPIGALDTWIVHIVPKNQALQNPSNKINLKQVIPPFEQTLRFQVNLPRNQLYVTRVSGRCSMSEILLQACKEKNLDASKYTLRHPKYLDKPLCDEMSIAEYGHNQVTMLSIKNVPTSVSTEDILMMNKYKTQSDSGSGSAASSVSPIPPVQQAKPIRKRRPAPKPPVQQKPQQSETIICHSRTSSDSSGYHEASVLSESPDSNNSSLPDSLPRRSKLPTVEPSKVESKLSRSLSNLHQASTSAAVSSGLKPAQSTSCLAPSRKKKPAPAPPIAIAEEKEEKSATLPPCARLLETPQEPSNPTTVLPAPRLLSSTDDQDKESGNHKFRLSPLESSVGYSCSKEFTKFKPFPLSNFRGLDSSLSSSVSSLNMPVCDTIPKGLVKRLSEQLLDVALLPKTPLTLNNPLGGVPNSIKKFENMNTKIALEKEMVPEYTPVYPIQSRSSFFPAKKIPCLDAVPVMPSNVMEELQARLAGNPPVNNVKKLLYKFEISNSDTSTAKSFHNAYEVFNSKNLNSMTTQYQPNISSFSSSDTSASSSFKRANHSPFIPDMERLSQQTSPDLMLPPPIMGNDDPPDKCCNENSSEPTSNELKNIEETAIESYINMIDESLPPIEGDQFSVDDDESFLNDNFEGHYSYDQNKNTILLAHNSSVDGIDRANGEESDCSSLSLSCDKKEEEEEDSPSEVGAPIVDTNVGLELPESVDYKICNDKHLNKKTAESGHQLNCTLNRFHNVNNITSSNYTTSNEALYSSDSNFERNIQSVVTENQIEYSISSPNNIKKTVIGHLIKPESSPIDGNLHVISSHTFDIPNPNANVILEARVPVEDCNSTTHLKTKQQEGRRESLESIVSYESCIYESMKPIPEEITDALNMNTDIIMNEESYGKVNIKPKTKTVTFSEHDSIKETSSDDGSVESFKKKKRFSSPLHLDFLKRKGKSLFGKGKKKSTDWNHADHVKAENFCTCSEPDLVYVRVPRTTPTRNAAFKLKRNESPLSDCSDHTYMAMEAIKPSTSQENSEPAESKLLHEKLKELLNSRPEEFL